MHVNKNFHKNRIGIALTQCLWSGGVVTCK